MQAFKNWILSEQILGTILVVSLVVLNRKINLNLSTSDLAMIAGSVGALVLGESHKDAMTARAAQLAPEIQGDVSLVMKQPQKA